MTAETTPDAERFSPTWGTKGREEAHRIAHAKAVRAWTRLDYGPPLTPEERAEAEADINAHDALYRCVGGTRRLEGVRGWR